METTLDDYSDFLALRDDRNEPFILVGGQAANFWAHHYGARVPELRLLEPFTSQDADFFGTIQDAKAAGETLGLRVRVSSIEAPDPVAGYLTPGIRGSTGRVEFLHWVMNLSESEIRSSAVKGEWKGANVRVLLPPHLLQSKTACLAYLPQAGRQDEKHVRLLLPCTRCFLEDTALRVKAGSLSERGCINTLKHLFALSSSNAARSASRKYSIQWSVMTPPASMFSGMPKVSDFIVKTAGKRYPQCFPENYFAAVPKVGTLTLPTDDARSAPPPASFGDQHR